ncbi:MULTISPECIES: hypothetical protein [Actinomyces]|uniref:Uridine kinase n=1 Tax=Actinomyces respiraculi TaxID=2744574 RepID=A0A7T0LJW2_9ACTO|nr:MULTISPECIES: hypothetical protein [Actinomyces]QPL04503.1 hypothetical protein ID810_06695 [Actinomyces respiraculi]
MSSTPSPADTSHTVHSPGGWRSDLLTGRPGVLLTGPAGAPDAVVSRVGRSGAGTLVVIDGTTGSGKTDLAGRVRQLLAHQGRETYLLPTDLLVPGWQTLAEGVTRTAELLAALARGGEGRAPTWDWERMAPGDELRLPALADGVLVVEGCGALAAAAQDLAPLTVVRVLVEAPQELRYTRIAARDSYTWDIEAWQAQEERVRLAWEQTPAWWPQVLVRHGQGPASQTGELS